MLTKTRDEALAITLQSAARGMTVAELAAAFGQPASQILEHARVLGSNGRAQLTAGADGSVLVELVGAAEGTAPVATTAGIPPTARRRRATKVEA